MQQVMVEELLAYVQGLMVLMGIRYINDNWKKSRMYHHKYAFGKQGFLQQALQAALIPLPY